MPPVAAAAQPAQEQLRRCLLRPTSSGSAHRRVACCCCRLPVVAPRRFLAWLLLLALVVDAAGAPALLAAVTPAAGRCPLRRLWRPLRCCHHLCPRRLSFPACLPAYPASNLRGPTAAAHRHLCRRGGASWLLLLCSRSASAPFVSIHAPPLPQRRSLHILIVLLVRRRVRGDGVT